MQNNYSKAKSMPSHFQAWLIDFFSHHLTFFVHLPDIFCTFTIKNKKEALLRDHAGGLPSNSIGLKRHIAVNGDMAVSTLFRSARHQARRDGHATTHRNQ